jgi:hypothetical protein
MKTLVLLHGFALARYFDVPRIRPNSFYDEDAPSLSERLAELDSISPIELQNSTARIADIRMTILNDFNHVMPFKFGNSQQIYKLVPDTGLSEVAVMTSACKNCTGVSPVMWTPPSTTGGANITGIIDEVTYFYHLHAFDTKIKGTFYKLPVCVQDDPYAAVCLLNFNVFGISATKPFFTANGDGYMGLGLGDSLGDHNQFSFLSQLKDHGLIDKKIFSIYTQMSNLTDTPSQIRFGAYNTALFNGTELWWINTLNSSTW